MATPTTPAPTQIAGRQPGRQAAAEALEVVGHRRQAARVGEHERDAAIGEEAAERGDEGRHAAR